MTVPALVLDSGAVLTEVIGICAYLEGVHPERPLLGATPLEKAQVLSWDHRLFNMVMMGVAEILRNGSPNFADRGLPGPLDVPQIPELVERGRLRLAHAWTWLDQELDGRTWLAGDKPSLADIDLLVCAGFSGWVKQSPPDSWSTCRPSWNGPGPNSSPPDRIAGPPDCTATGAIAPVGPHPGPGAASISLESPFGRQRNHAMPSKRLLPT